MEIIKPSYEIIFPTTQADVEGMFKRIEIAGRTCYKSKSPINYETGQRFVRARIKDGHEAMLEFGDIHILFTVDRGIANEIVRHRIFSFAQESTRYVKYSDGIKVICPPDIEADEEAFQVWTKIRQAEEEEYAFYLDRGIKKEIARSCLPLSLKTELNVKGNFREWRHFFKLRTATFAHPQLREVTIPLLEELQTLIPGVFDDITAE